MKEKKNHAINVRVTADTKETILLLCRITKESQTDLVTRLLNQELRVVKEPKL